MVGQRVIEMKPFYDNYENQYHRYNLLYENHFLIDFKYPDKAPIKLGTIEGEALATLFSNDKKIITTFNSNGEKHQWDLDLKNLINLACKKVGRNLTCKEWMEYFIGSDYKQTCPNIPPNCQSEENIENIKNTIILINEEREQTGK